MPTILTPGKLRQEHHEFDTSLRYFVRHHLKNEMKERQAGEGGKKELIHEKNQNNTNKKKSDNNK
jgi:hypothetical protein